MILLSIAGYNTKGTTMRSMWYSCSEKDAAPTGTFGLIKISNLHYLVVEHINDKGSYAVLAQVKEQWLAEEILEAILAKAAVEWLEKTNKAILEGVTQVDGEG
jgi:hypothetical protein